MMHKPFAASKAETLVEWRFSWSDVRAARAAFLITHDESVAQDVVQETFIRICQRIHQFDESRPFEPYLMRNVVHAALNAVRGSDRLVSLEDESAKVESLLDRAAFT